MIPYKRRGVALNFQFFQRHISTHIPYIYHTFKPEDWVLRGDHLVARTANKIYGRGTNLSLTMNGDNFNQMEYYLIRETPSYYQLLAKERPDHDVVLMAFALPDADIHTYDLYPSAFYHRLDQWIAEWPLPDTGDAPVLLATFEWEEKGFPVFFDNYIQDGVLILNSLYLPPFTTHIKVYTVKSNPDS